MEIASAVIGSMYCASFRKAVWAEMDRTYCEVRTKNLEDVRKNKCQTVCSNNTPYHSNVNGWLNCYELNGQSYVNMSKFMTS